MTLNCDDASIMKAIEIKNKKLVAATRPLPRLKRGDVLIRVQAAGVNRPDILQRLGYYPPPKGASDIPGLEIAGIVERGGKRFKKGDKVCALLSGGGYAEFVSVPEGQCLPVPRGLNLTQAAGLPETFFTVWTNLVDSGKLKKGETVLIHGGSSGIGVAAIQVAKALGAKVIVTAGSDKKCATCKKLGAVLAINYKKKDFVKEIHKATKGNGVDVVLDMVGGSYLQRNINCLAAYGRHVSIAAQQGRKADIDISSLMQKRLILTGSTLRNRSVAEKATIAKAVEKNIWPLLSKKKIRPVIDSLFPLERAQNAHLRMEKGQHIGKIILIINNM